MGLGSPAVRSHRRSAYLATTPHSSVMLRLASPAAVIVSPTRLASGSAALAAGRLGSGQTWQRQASAVPEHPIQVLLLRTNDLRFEATRRQIERIISADGISAIEARAGRRSIASAIDREIHPLPNGRFRTFGRVAHLVKAFL